MELEKVAGEENPADLLTKHSLSRQRLEKLVALHGCKYLGGRASSAPQVREGESTKATMASLGGGLIATAADIVDTVASERIAAQDDSTFSRLSPVDPANPAAEPSQVRPFMPHLELFGQALDDSYPPMTAPKDEDMQDADLDADDATLQTGLREAVAIAAEARDQGRKRKMSPITRSSKEMEKETENVVKLLLEQEEATIRSTLGRRRSKRKVLVPQPQDLPQEPFAGYSKKIRKNDSDVPVSYFCRASLSH